MARKPSVRWNESKQRWMAWVRFPDGTRRKVERVDKADAQADLDELVALRAQEQAPDPRHTKQLTFNDVLDDWFEAGCPNVAPTRTSRHARQKSANTIANARQLLGTSVRPAIGHQWVDRTTTERLEALFQDMAANKYATSTIDRTWNYLNQACQHAQRARRTKTNPAADVLLPARRPSKPRKSLTLEQAEKLITKGIPEDPRPAMWLTGLMCGLRPGELAGLRWPFVDIDSDEPSLTIAERPRWVVHYTPPHASWVNQVELFFSIPQRKVIRNGSFDSRDDLIAKLLGFIADYDQTASPFKWTYAADPLKAA